MTNMISRIDDTLHQYDGKVLNFPVSSETRLCDSFIDYKINFCNFKIVTVIHDFDKQKGWAAQNLMVEVRQPACEPFWY